MDKDALVAEIEKMKNKAYPNSDWNHGYVASCEKILSFLDTLEVKEVDNIDAFIERACKYISYHQCEYIDFEDFRKAMKGE